VTKTLKRATLVLAMTPLVSIPAVGAYAATTAPLAAAQQTTKTATRAAAQTTTTVTTPAPAASASAVAAKVAGIVTIGESKATASSTGGTAHADALNILGTSISGGDANPGESKSGALLATPDNPIGDAELAPWAAKGSAAGPTTSAQAEAALAHAGLLGVLQLWLLHSQSTATWTSATSHGHAESDGAEVNLADQLDVKVLHAETDSSGKASSAVLVINGQGILTSDQTGGACAIDADPLASILCLQAAGGAGSAGSGTTSSAADVVSETSGVGLPGADVVGATSAGGTVAKPVTSTTSGSRTPHKPTTSTATGSVGSGNPATSRLPFTGGESGLLAIYGAMLTGLGAAITAAARRRRTAHQ
jgi:hypothetical protein